MVNEFQITKVPFALLLDKYELNIFYQNYNLLFLNTLGNFFFYAEDESYFQIINYLLTLFSNP